MRFALFLIEMLSLGYQSRKLAILLSLEFQCSTTVPRPTAMTDNAVFHAIPHLKYSTGVAVTSEVVVGSSLHVPSLPPSPSFSSSSSRYISPSYCPIAASLGLSHRSSLSRRQLLAFMADNTNIGVIMSLASLPPRHLLRPPLPAPKMNLLLPTSVQASG